MPIEIMLYSLIPVLALFIGSFSLFFIQPSAKTTSFFQHFAAGVILAAVSLELLPELSSSKSITTFIIGFSSAIVLMLLIKLAFPHDSHDKEHSHNIKTGKLLPLSFIAPIAIDLFIDGLLVGVAFLAGAKGGVLVALALSIEVIFLSLSMGNIVQTQTKIKVFSLNLLFAFSILLGSLLGIVLTKNASPILLQGILSFGVAALLYLVIEELLIEAHEVKDTPIITSSFFIGFLIIYIINKLM